MKKTGFKDRAAIKKEDRKPPSEDMRQLIWNFAQPRYDDRSDGSMNAGTHYGVGIRQPVGKEKCSSHFGDGKEIPFGRPKTMEVDEVG